MCFGYSDYKVLPQTVRVVVSEVERENGDREHTYAHLPNKSTPGESADLVIMVKKKVIKRGDTPGEKAVEQKVRRKRHLPATASNSNEHSSQRDEHDHSSNRSWRLGGSSKQKNARVRPGDATLEHGIKITQTTPGSPSHFPTASGSRRHAAAPSSTIKVESPVATQEAKSHRHQTAPGASPIRPTPVKSSLDRPDGSQMTSSMPDGSQSPVPPGTMFQQPGMSLRQSNAFVFRPALQDLHRSRPASDTSGSAVASAPGSNVASRAKTQPPASSSLLEFSQLQTQMLAQLPPPAQADAKARQSHYRSKLGQLLQGLQPQACAQMTAELEARMEAQLNSVGLGTADFGNDVEDGDLIGL
ncbi:hypothetical protein E8E11_008678 [Didymella keratinophila]|nr:hypothetical protein E8E11_008678 [Didymella keratinophila]